MPTLPSPHRAGSAPALLTLLTILGVGVAALGPSAVHGKARLDEHPIAPAYAGSARCAGCHADAYARWQGSHHALADRPPPKDLPRTAPQAVASHEVTRVLGVHPIWQPVLRTRDGHEQVFEQAYDVEREAWFLAFESKRPANTWGHWRGRGMTFATMCIECHETSVDRGYDAKTDRFNYTYSERGVGCEACHGPSLEHTMRPAVPPLQARPTAQTCGPCHSRRVTLDSQGSSSEQMLDRYLLLTAAVPGLYYPDGQVQDEVFEYASFLGSKMHDRGVTCATCHEPHSGTLRKPAETLCRDCHDSQPGFQAHDHHPNATVTCVDCHMPTTVYMQRHPRRDHSFSIPDPGLTIAAAVPNACNRCHDQESAEWARSKLQTWFPARLRPSQQRARIIARLAQQDASAVSPALDLLVTESNAYWRSVLAGRLAPFIQHRSVRQNFIALAEDPEALVRVQVADALGVLVGPDVSAVLHRLAADPTRSVRVAAQRSLSPHYEPEAAIMVDFVDYLDANSDQPAAARARGTWLLRRGRAQEAIPWFERAVRWDPQARSSQRGLAQARSAVSARR